LEVIVFVIQIASFAITEEIIKSVLLPDDFSNDNLQLLYNADIRFLKIGVLECDRFSKNIIQSYSYNIEYNNTTIIFPVIGAMFTCDDPKYEAPINYILSSMKNKFFGIVATSIDYAILYRNSYLGSEELELPGSAYIKLEEADEYLFYDSNGTIKKYLLN
jgi:hypothetical protein